MGWFTVSSPSAQPAAHPAVDALIAPPNSAGGSSGSDQSRASCTVTSPSWVTSAPRHSARMMSTHSASRCMRSGFVGQASPVTCSLSASPLPSATHGSRPGNMAATVPIACAEITG